MPPPDPLGLQKALDGRRIHSTFRQLTTRPCNSVDFSSNDFLSLASSSELRQAFLRELENEPSVSDIGSGGSRLLDGNSEYAETLEQDIAAFHRSPAGLLCNSGFDANVGLFSCLPQLGDFIVYDELIHASVHDGMRLSRAGQCLAFQHNDVQALGRVLQQCVASDEAVQHGRKNVFVAVETVYSMTGDVAPLREIVDLVRMILPAGNGHLIVDEAHSTGVFGPRGRGLVCELGLENEFAVRLHTFGKALACGGAIILASPLIRQYLINYARPLIYTTFMPYPSLAAIRAAYTLLQRGTTEPLVQHLHALIEHLYERLLRLEASLRLPSHLQNLLRVPTGQPQSAISYVMSSEPRKLAVHCQGKGFLVRGIVSPTVPAGTERVRICLHAGNTLEQVTGLVDAIYTWVNDAVRKSPEIVEQAKL